MIRIHCFGAARLDAPAAASPESVLAQPKRLAILAFLTLSDSEMEARDTLLATFWPDAPESSARGSLRQALRYLRRALGDDVLAARSRGWVGVNRQRVACDVWEFDRLLEAGDRAAALALYGGELLQGLELRGSPGFERWLAGRRRELALRAGAAARELAEEARESGDVTAALGWARRAREILPGDEEGIRHLMGVQLWAGDRSGALQTYERFAQWLASEYEATPSVKTRELAERARGPLGTGSPTTGGSAVATPAVAALAARAGRGAGGAPGARAVAPPLRRRWSWRDGSIGVVAAGVGVLLVGWSLNAVVAGPPAENGGLVRERVVVHPFQVEGPEASLGVMRAGMPEIFQGVFTGDPGPRAVPAAEGEAGRGERAEWSVSGVVMGDDRQVYLQGALVGSGPGAPHFRASLSGSADSLYTLARELAMRLLALHAGVSPEDAALLARTEPAALRAYLSGRDAYRRGRYEEADGRFKEALDYDSLFAQAAVGLLETHLGAPWLRGHAFATALPLAFRLRDRLSPSDREVVTAIAGPRYPLPSTQAEHYRAWERAVAQAPERAAVWYQWGDVLYHVGPFIGIPDHRARAAAAFERGLRVDSTYLLPLSHLVEISLDAGRIDRALDFMRRYLDDPRDPATADYLRWRIAVATGDEADRSALRAHFPDMDVASLGAIMKAAQFTGRGLEDAEAIAALDINRWTAPAERWTMLFRRHSLALNRGRTDEARELAEAMEDVAPGPSVSEFMLIRGALFGGGDSAAADRAVRRLAARVDLSQPHDPAARPDLIDEVCAVQAWRAHQGDAGGLRETIRWLRDPAMHAASENDRPRRWCARYLETLAARLEGPGRGHENIERLAGMMREGVDIPGLETDALHFLLAELLEEAGDIDGALEAIRLRRSVPYLLAPRLLREAQLATLAGDTAAAARAHRHYRALRAGVSLDSPPLRVGG